MELIYQDKDIVVCIKPPRVKSTDEPGGLPELVRQELRDPQADIRTVHRLDQVVSGLMVLARNAKAASELSRQIREDQFSKEYLAVIHGKIEQPVGTLRDLLARDKARRMTMIATEPGKGVQEAVLEYRLLGTVEGTGCVAVKLHTGRTHQIRVQFSSRGFPLVGERKYSTREDPCEIALWSWRLAFVHPVTGEPMTFCHRPPSHYPWSLYQHELENAMCKSHFDFFQNRECEYFPCHDAADPATFNCLFCFCPLYCLGERCGGNFRYLDNGIKDCSRCLRPHQRENYCSIMEQMDQVMDLAKRP